MHLRRDAAAGAARFILEGRELARTTGGTTTVGQLAVLDGIVTAVPALCELSFDQRHLDPDVLAAMLRDARAASDRIAADEGLSVDWAVQWRIAPHRFDPHLVDLADEAVREAAGQSHRMPSGALHDAAQTAAAGVPTVMLFVQSLRGLSHNAEEDTREEHLELSVTALDRLAAKTIEWVAGGGGRD
jgi:N-carbamoyl-L-amino-acid hydrolase